MKPHRILHVTKHTATTIVVLVLEEVQKNSQVQSTPFNTLTPPHVFHLSHASNIFQLPTNTLQWPTRSQRLHIAAVPSTETEHRHDQQPGEDPEASHCDKMQTQINRLGAREVPADLEDLQVLRRSRFALIL